MFVVLGHNLAAQMDLAVCPQDHNASAENSNTYEHLKSVAAPCALAPECGASCRVLDQPQRSRPNLRQNCRKPPAQKSYARLVQYPTRTTEKVGPSQATLHIVVMIQKVDRIANGRDNRALPYEPTITPRQNRRMTPQTQTRASTAKSANVASHFQNRRTVQTLRLTRQPRTRARSERLQKFA